VDEALLEILVAHAEAGEALGELARFFTVKGHRISGSESGTEASRA
jgi:hypothetical protein